MNKLVLSFALAAVVLALGTSSFSQAPAAPPAAPPAPPAVKDKEPDVIPPEILGQMDPLIVAGKRPVIKTIHQKDIFALRTNPKLKADFVTFEFDATKLSSVQRDIINKWIRGGHNSLYLEGAQMHAYAPFLKPVKCDMARRAVTKLLRHKVNTDTPGVIFLEADLRAYTYSFHVPLTNLPRDSEVIAETKSGAALCGSMTLEEGKIYFRSKLDKTPDARRWLLNWWHWAMGLNVPGAADTRVRAGLPRPSTLAQKMKHDALALRSGETASGDVLDKAFTIKTPYATLTFETAKIAKIAFGGSGSTADTLTLRTGDAFGGTAILDSVTVRKLDATEVKLAKDKIKEIVLRPRRPGEPEPASKPSLK